MSQDVEELLEYMYEPENAEDEEEEEEEAAPEHPPAEIQCPPTPGPAPRSGSFHKLPPVVTKSPSSSPLLNPKVICAIKWSATYFFVINYINH